MRAGQPLNSTRRRLRKEQLARRHGQRCAYCRRPFNHLKDATLDHIVPLSLWRSWSVTSLMLACFDCNQAKADRFPLLLALTLCAAFTSTGVNDPSTPVNPASTPVEPAVDAPTVHVDGPAFTADSETFIPTGVNPTSTPVDVTVDAPPVHVDGTPVHVGGAAVHVAGPVSLSVSRGVSPVSPLVGAVSPIVLPVEVWRLLARLALVHRPVFTAVWRPDPIRRRSTPCLHESTRPTRRARVVSTRPACLRAPRSVRACAGPAGEAVPA